MRAARWLVLLTVALALLVCLVPIKGTNINQSGLSVSCGPAIGATTGLTGPSPSRDLSEVILSSPGGDVGLSKRAWCQQEAGRWLRPGLAIAGGVLVAAAVAAIASLGLGLRRQTTSLSRVDEDVLRP